VSDAFVGDGAVLRHLRLQLQGPRALQVSTLGCRQARDSRYAAFAFDLGGRLVRHDLGAVLDGEGADCRLWGLYLTSGEQHLDHHTVLDHARPHGGSREVYKGILDGRSRTVFNGRIVVREGAQKTDAKQSNPNLLLSAHALAHTRPQLEIYADDVKCTHGATVGRLDEEPVFYLRTRGVPEAEARNMLIRAFAGEVLDSVPNDVVREYLARAVDERLARRSAA
jgi:Fe-S cluster assembly protein SufD